jgi:hypothetical protein
MADIQTNSKNELASLFAAIEKVNHRLDKLEGGVKTPAITPTIDASQEKFSIAEAIADAIFDGTLKEKACTFEPNDKPCDHCSMCSSRGF